MSSEEQDELSPEELTALLGSFMPEIPGYRVMRRIGKGGMSQVYLGVQESLDRQVAIKIMDPAALTDERTKTRFEQEARTIAKLEHPCIVGIHEVGRTRQGLMYYVLPYLAKGHLGQRDFSKDENRVIEVLRALLSALEYAHARGIVHRDVKAENVLFDNADRPLLTDFGIALARRDTTRITTAGIAVGSGGYMAPEQARGEAVDGRADLYAVGVLAFELLAGHLPFSSGDPLGLALMHAQDPIPRLPPERKRWQVFVDRAMAKSPENRYRNAQQMLAALNELVRGDTPAASEAAASAINPAAQPGKGKRNLRQPLLLFVLLTAVILGAFALYQQRAARAKKAPDFFTGSEITQPPAAVATAPDNTATDNSTGITAIPADTLPSAMPSGTDAAGTVSSPADPVVSTDIAGIDPATNETALTQGAGGFASVTASASYTALSYDPSVLGARQLAAAQRQLAHKRVSTPPGDNALDSLLSVRKLAPSTAELPALSDQVISQLAGNVIDALKGNRDDAAQTAYARAQKAAKDLGRLDEPVWTKLHADMLPRLISRLERATASQDRAAIERSKALAISLGISPEQLEPAWSNARIEVVKAKAGDVLKGDGPTMILVTAPGDGPGLAMMREEVSRGEYASFASATGRAAAKCTNPLAQLFNAKRSWNDPGFEQNNQHPVVCVSHADALAYAQWLGQKTGKRYRLPNSTDWQRVSSYGGSSEPCRSGHISCGAHGTAAGGGFPASPLGLHDLQGNVSEWLADAASAGKHLTAGASWRDIPSRARRPPQATPDDRGHDDVGFRLVREVTNEDLGQ